MPLTPSTSLEAPIQTSSTQPNIPSINQDLTPETQANNDNHFDPCDQVSKISEVFCCSAPDFYGDDNLVIYDSQTFITENEGNDLSSSKAVQQHSSLPKKKSSSSSSDPGFSEGVSVLNLFSLTKGINLQVYSLLISKLSPYSVRLDYKNIDVWNLSMSRSSSKHSLNLSVELEPNSSPSFL
ncbi:hypothetical protein RHSIM_Rhsim09G0059400 [Rhododendron simsii]|uniref:Uncharacterized protein n=1 Tax=Rhododendron simsii TaxID=118357 RepID=A0A834LEW0_RHOSS|nr:hypothetical protein RHSIM_Rhsim09G0059400 [Rhododendron simsii]